MQIVSPVLRPKFGNISRDLREQASPAAPTSLVLKVDGADLKTYGPILSPDGHVKLHHNGPHFFATVPGESVEILDQPKGWKHNSLLFHLINTCDAFRGHAQSLSQGSTVYV